jgi:O-methyltransferase involved in polyketide biosynthesis
MSDRSTWESGERIRTDALRGVAQTCLIPLGLRAADARSRSSVLNDRRAVEIAGKIEIDWDPLCIPEASACAALVRAREIDRWVLAFILEGGRTAVVSIGSGLDTWMTRLASRPDVWADIELPEVAALRKILVSDEGPARTISSSFLDTG